MVLKRLPFAENKNNMWLFDTGDIKNILFKLGRFYNLIITLN